MKDVADLFEHALYRLTVRMVHQVVQEDNNGHLDNKVGKYVDDYVKSPRIRKDVHKAISRFCRNDVELVDEIRRVVGAIIDGELKQMVTERLQEVKVGDKSFTDWLVRVAIKESLTSEAVHLTIETTIKTHIEDVMRRVLATGLTGLSGK